MISNLKSAKALIQADLDHARNVLRLWQDQVGELEKTLAQLDAVDNSRGVLRVEYASQKGSAPMLSAEKTAMQGGRKGRKTGVRSEHSALGSGQRRRARQPSGQENSAQLKPARMQDQAQWRIQLSQNAAHGARRNQVCRRPLNTRTRRQIKPGLDEDAGRHG